jgi:hypothetical protein
MRSILSEQASVDLVIGEFSLHRVSVPGLTMRVAKDRIYHYRDDLYVPRNIVICVYSYCHSVVMIIYD